MALKTIRTEQCCIALIEVTGAPAADVCICCDDMDFTFTYLIDNDVIISANDENTLLAAGSVATNASRQITIKFGRHHTRMLLLGCKQKLFNIGAEFLGLGVCSGENESVCFRCPDHRIKNIIAELGDMSDDIAGRSLFINSRAQELARLFLEGMQKNFSAGTVSPRTRLVEAVKCYIEAHFDEALTITSLAKEFAINRTDLKETFHRSFNKTIHRYVLECRMEHAKYLLSYTDKPIGMICHLTGYHDFSSFSRAFQLYAHTSPSAYRKAGRPNC